jgi:hypothetical protein
MQIDLDLSKDLCEAFFNPRPSSLFQERALLNYAGLAVRLGTPEGWVRRNARRT